MLVDSHCHLNFPDFKDDLDAVIQRARDAGVTVMQTICTGMEEFDEVHAIAQKYEGVYCSVGVHPNESGNEKVVTAAELLEKTRFSNVIGIGETGLDYHYFNDVKNSSENIKNSIKIQKNSFQTHISSARQSGLPVIIHSRDADEDTVEILTSEMQAGKYKGLIHCFTGTKYLADKSVELGLYISVSGIITFKNAQAIRDALQDVPLERLLVETDAPYLAPAPHRGKRNEPSFTIYTNRMLAEVKGISEEECARITTGNFYRLFDKVPA
jgi:TatD DNase family protein